MGFFTIPPTSPYDLNFSVFGIPVRVHPLFWVIMLLFASSTPRLSFILIWIGVAFVSILVHELGHSLMMQVFGQGSYIVLYGGGGLAVHDAPTGSRYRNVSLTAGQQIAVSFAGPLAGFVLAGLTLLVVWFLGGNVFWGRLLFVIPVPNASIPTVGFIGNTIVRLMLFINVYWGLINLAPVYPLDGGRIAREIFTTLDGRNGLVNSLWLSVAVGAGLAIFGFVSWGSWYMALLFGLLAFESFRMIQSFSGRF